MEQILKELGLANEFAAKFRENRITVQHFSKFLQTSTNMHQQRLELAKILGMQNHQILLICDKIKEQYHKDGILAYTSTQKIIPRMSGQVVGGTGMMIGSPGQAASQKPPTISKRVSQLLQKSKPSAAPSTSNQQSRINSLLSSSVGRISQSSPQTSGQLHSIRCVPLAGVIMETPAQLRDAISSTKLDQNTLHNNENPEKSSPSLQIIAKQAVRDTTCDSSSRESPSAIGVSEEHGPAQFQVMSLHPVAEDNQNNSDQKSPTQLIKQQDDSDETIPLTEHENIELRIVKQAVVEKDQQIQIQEERAIIDEEEKNAHENISMGNQVKDQENDIENTQSDEEIETKSHLDQEMIIEGHQIQEETQVNFQQKLNNAHNQLIESNSMIEEQEKVKIQQPCVEVELNQTDLEQVSLQTQNIIQITDSEGDQLVLESQSQLNQFSNSEDIMIQNQREHEAQSNTQQEINEGNNENDQMEEDAQIQDEQVIAQTFEQDSVTNIEREYIVPPASEEQQIQNQYQYLMEEDEEDVSYLEMRETQRKRMRLNEDRSAFEGMYDEQEEDLSYIGNSQMTIPPQSQLYPEPITEQKQHSLEEVKEPLYREEVITSRFRDVEIQCDPWVPPEVKKPMKNKKLQVTPDKVDKPRKGEAGYQDGSTPIKSVPQANNASPLLPPRTAILKPQNQLSGSAISPTPQPAQEQIPKPQVQLLSGFKISPVSSANHQSNQFSQADLSPTQSLNKPSTLSELVKATTPISQLQDKEPQTPKGNEYRFEPRHHHQYTVKPILKKRTHQMRDKLEDEMIEQSEPNKREAQRRVKFDEEVIKRDIQKQQRFMMLLQDDEVNQEYDDEEMEYVEYEEEYEEEVEEELDEEGEEEIDDPHSQRRCFDDADLSNNRPSLVESDSEEENDRSYQPISGVQRQRQEHRPQQNLHKDGNQWLSEMKKFVNNIKKHE